MYPQRELGWFTTRAIALQEYRSQRPGGGMRGYMGRLHAKSKTRPGFTAYKTGLGQTLTVPTYQVTPKEFTVPFAEPKKEEPGLIDNLLNMWNNRPQALKDIRIRVNPQTAMQTLQQLLPAKNVEGAASYLRRIGIEPSYLTRYGEQPLTPGMIGYGYRAAGFDWGAMMP